VSLLFRGSDSDDDAYDRAMSDRSMFNRESRDEWQRKRDRAREIASGYVSGMFERDEEILKMVREMREQE
jgi:hypothetical protein